MKNTSYIALSRQTALWRQLETVANNLANMNTSGYRGEDLLFTDYLVRSPNTESVFRDQIRFVQDIGTITDTTPAPLNETGNPLDLALKGQNTFFVIETPAGQRYTRAGHFSLNEQGQLVTDEGQTVLSSTDTPIFIAPTESRIEITSEGTVHTENGPVGQLKVVATENLQRMRREGKSLWAPLSPDDIKPAQTPQVIQSMLEGSNVNSIIEMTRMIDVQRSYQNVQTLIEQENNRVKGTMEAWSRRI